MIRLFAAIEVPEPLAEKLASMQSGLPGVRWRPLEALHVTLGFFGEMDRPRADDLDGELSRVTCKPFDLSLTGVGEFGHAHQSDTLWAGVEPNPMLDILHGRCQSAARRAGLTLPSRPYRPHVTLAYLHAPAPPTDQIADWLRAHNLKRFDPFRVDRFGLYSSRLKADGSRYTLEREYML